MKSILLNPELVERQNLSMATVQAIEALHRLKYAMYDLPLSEVVPSTYTQQMEELEYKVQSHWGFEANSDYHRWWLDDPKCQCPKLDNLDYLGTSMHIYSSDCPLHSHLLQEDH